MSPVLSIDPNRITTSELHGYLISAVAPRPIAFASTVDAAGNVNLSPFSFFNVFSANPPIMIFSPSRRGHDNTTKHTYDNLLEVPETVINIVNYAIVEQMSLASTEYERGVNEFVKAGLTPAPSVKVRPPRVDESPVSFECTVDNIVSLGDQGGAGNLVICRVVMIHVHEAYLDAEGRLDPAGLDQVGRMGGSWYARAGRDALFQIPRPARNKGIGVDGLPESVRTSAVLTGNNLGRLGNAERLPDAEAVETMKKDPAVAKLIEEHHGDPAEMQTALHRLAKSYLEQGAVEKALQILLIEA